MADIGWLGNHEWGSLLVGQETAIAIICQALKIPKASSLERAFLVSATPYIGKPPRWGTGDGGVCSESTLECLGLALMVFGSMSYFNLSEAWVCRRP